MAGTGLGVMPWPSAEAVSSTIAEMTSAQHVSFVCRGGGGPGAEWRSHLACAPERGSKVRRGVSHSPIAHRSVVCGVLRCKEWSSDCTAVLVRGRPWIRCSASASMATRADGAPKGDDVVELGVMCQECSDVVPRRLVVAKLNECRGRAVADGRNEGMRPFRGLAAVSQ